MKINKSLVLNDLSYPEYWTFSSRRQSAFTHKSTVSDPIINKYKFTNCYRFLDRTSQYLIKNIINNDHLTPEDAFVQIIIFKLFNRIETWESIWKEFGHIGSNMNFKSLTVFLDNLKTHSKIYSAAYIMPSGTNQFGNKVKHHNNISMLEYMIKREFHKKIWSMKNLRDIYSLFLSVPTLGKFLSYQYAIDIAYSSYSFAEEAQFVIAGPGAIRGIKKCFLDIGHYSYEDVIKIIFDNQHDEFKRFGLQFDYVGERDLQLIDCQNIFCEVDKYLRVKLPELDIKPAKIKQLYRPKLIKIDFEAPKKWSLEF